MDHIIENLMYGLGEKAAETVIAQGLLSKPIEIEGGATGIPIHDIEPLALMTQAFIAQIIQHYIDAGSERDVIMEDEELFLVLERVFRDWSPDWEKTKKYSMEVK